MISFEDHTDENYILITKVGILSLAETASLMQSVKEYEHYTPSANRLYNFSQTQLDWSFEDINQLINYIRKKFSQANPPIKVAIVNSDSTEKAMLDLFVSLAEHKLNRQFGLFNTLSKAKKWITSEDENPPPIPQARQEE